MFSTVPSVQLLCSSEERTLFLGDLSCFCQGVDVHRFFKGCGEIESIRLMHHKSTNRFLGYGFITFMDINALPLAKRLHGSMLLGRPINIGLAMPRKTSSMSPPTMVTMMNYSDSSCSNRKNTNKKPSSTSAQLHFSYLSQQVNKLVTEETIRNVFTQFGEIQDVMIKKSSFEANGQSGYGFVYFSLNRDGSEAAIRAAAVISQVVIDYVLYDCRLTRSFEASLHQPSNQRRSTDQKPPVNPPFLGKDSNEPGVSLKTIPHLQFSTYDQPPRIEGDVYPQHHVNRFIPVNIYDPFIEDMNSCSRNRFSGEDMVIARPSTSNVCVQESSGHAHCNNLSKPSIIDFFHY